MEEAGPSGNNEDGLHRGPWAEWEDELLGKYVAKYGEGNWASVKEKPDIGLKRCGKSCRLRYLNHLKPGLKKGAFSEDEEDLIFTLHTYYGNKWSRIALELPGRTDNEIKNFYHYKCKKLENAKLPVPGQSAEDKERAHTFVQSRLASEELTINLFPSSGSLLGKREPEGDSSDREIKHQKLETARSQPSGHSGNSNITLRIPLIGPPKALRFTDNTAFERQVPLQKPKQLLSSKSLESAGKLAQTAIDAARATVSAGGRAEDAAKVAAAAMHRDNAMETKPSDSVTNMMTGVARLAAEAVLPRANSAAYDNGAGGRFPHQHSPPGYINHHQQMQMLAQMGGPSAHQALKIQQQIAALFPASPVSILDVAQLDPQQRQLLEARLRVLLAGRGEALHREASDPARLEVLRCAVELDAARRMRSGGMPRPLGEKVEETLERAEAFLRPKQEPGSGSLGADEQNPGKGGERDTGRREEREFGRGQQNLWEEKPVLRREGEGFLGLRGGDNAEADPPRRGGEPLSLLHRDDPARERMLHEEEQGFRGLVGGASLRKDGGSIGSEEIPSEERAGLLAPKMRAFKELRRPQLDILGHGEDLEPGPLTAAVGRRISPPSENSGRTPEGGLWSPRLSAGRKKWAGPIWKTVNGHSVDISELSPDYVSELWGLDAETFACRTPTLSLFPGAISDDEAFSLSERGPSTSRSPSSSDGPWLPWPYDGKPVTRDEVSGKLVSPRTVMEAIESGPLSTTTPRSPSDNDSIWDGQLPSLGSRGSGKTPQWWLSLIATPREQKQEGGGDAVSPGGGLPKEWESQRRGPVEGGGLYREPSLKLDTKVGEVEPKGFAVEGEWASPRGKHRPTSSFSFTALGALAETSTGGDGLKSEGGDAGPRLELASGSPKQASILDQVRGLFTLPSGLQRNSE